MKIAFLQLTRSVAMKVQSWMRGREGGRYHVKRNNCQHFVEELWGRLSVDMAGKKLQDLQTLGYIAQDCRMQAQESKAGSMAVLIRDDTYSDDKMSMSTLCDD